MKTTGIFSILISISLVSCGGGGGGSDSQTSTPQSSVATSTSSSQASTSSSSSSSSNINENPIVSITYPRTDSLVSSNTLTVRGTVSDDKPITSIKVNGVDAEVTAIPKLTKTRNEKPSEKVDFSAEWEAQIEVPLGESKINVVATDSGGSKSNDPEDPIELKNFKLPLSLVVDSKNNRLVGTEGSSVLYEFNSINFAQTLLPEAKYYEFPIFDNLGVNIYSFKSDNQNIEIHSLNPTSGISSVEKSIPTPIDNQTDSGAYVYGATLDAENKTYYYLLGYADLTGTLRTHKIFKYNPTSDSIDEIATLAKTSFGLLSIGSDLYTISNGSVFNKYNVEKINTNNNQVSTIIENIDAQFLLSNSEKTKLYVVGRQDISVIDIGTNLLTVLSPKNQPDFLNFAQISSAAMDENNERLLISDVGIRQVISVDLKTGTRSYASKNTIGTGQKLVKPSNIVLTSDKKYIYALDDGLNAEESLYKIDLTSGDRTTVKIFSEYEQLGARGIALDETNDRIFVVFDNKVGEINLDNLAHRVIYNDLVGTGIAMSSINGIEYDKKNNRLLVTAPNEESIVSIDLTTLNRTIFIDPTMTNGIPLTQVIDINLNEQSTVLYALQQQSPSSKVELIKIDLETKQVSLLTDTCLDSQNNERMPSSFLSTLNVNSDQILISGDNAVLNYSITSDSCKVSGTPVLDVIQLTPDIAIGTMLNKILEVDLKANQSVIISQ